MAVVSPSAVADPKPAVEDPKFPSLLQQLESTVLLGHHHHITYLLSIFAAEILALAPSKTVAIGLSVLAFGLPDLP